MRYEHIKLYCEYIVNVNEILSHRKRCGAVLRLCKRDAGKRYEQQRTVYNGKYFHKSQQSADREQRNLFHKNGLI